jgi:hypothetical protein
MPASLATVDTLLKEVYQGRLQTQLQNESVGMRRIEQSSDGVESQVGGKYVTFPLKISRNQGIGYRNELEQLQSAGQAGYTNVRIGLKYGYGRIRLSGQIMELATSNSQAFSNAMDLEVSGLKEDVAKDQNRIFYGDGVGTMATVTSATGPLATFVVGSVQYLEVGQVIDIATSTSNSTLITNGTARTISAINTSTKTVTVSGAANLTVAVGNIVVRTGNWGREPNGLASLVSATGTLHNVDPTVVPQWKATVDSNGGTPRALAEALMVANVDAARVNGGKTSLILTTLGVRRSYFNLLSTQRRFTGNQEFAGGFKGLAFSAGAGGDIPLIEDVDAPAGTMYGLDESSIKVYRDQDWHFLNRDGSMWKWVHDFDAYEAVLAKYWELATNRRNANWVIKDITEA